MKTMINPSPPQRTTTWKGKLLRLLHIKRNKVDQPSITPHLKHHDLPYFPVVTVRSVPRTDSDDTPSDHLADLPRDIILYILSRLPLERIFMCQRLSRPLTVLTTTPFFTHMQRQRSPPVIVVQILSEKPGCKFKKLYYMNKELERVGEKIIGSSPFDRGSVLYEQPVITGELTFLLSSYEGFLLFADFVRLPTDFYMWNPTTGEQLIMRDYSMRVCGLYFHPVRKEHELLYYNILEGRYYKFGAYSLRTKKERHVGSFSYPPSRHRPPVLIKGTLYWMIDRSSTLFLVNREARPPFSHSIMSFNIQTEEFSTLEPGGRKYSTTEPEGDYSVGMMKIRELHLSEMDGELCLCDFVTYSELLLSIFNHATQCWSTSTVVILPEYHPSSLFSWPNLFPSEVVQIKDNELLVRQGRRILLYNMLSHDCKISEIMGCVGEVIRVTVHTHRFDSFHLPIY